LRLFRVFVLALFYWLMSGNLAAQTKGIATFGGLKNLEFIQQYYNGGTGSLGSGPGRDFQLEFTANAQAIISAAKGGSGNFIGNPGGYPVMFFGTGTGIVMNADAGVSTALWFSYSALQSGTATIYDGLNGTGNVLASVTLPPNNVGCNSYKMCVWTPVSFPLKTPVASIRFSGVANYLAISAIHFAQKIATSTTLASSENPSLLGDPVTFTAAVSAVGTVAAGTVRFKAGNTILGEIPLVNGAASVTTSGLRQGSTTIEAIFRGDSFVTSTATLVQSVN